MSAQEDPSPDAPRVQSDTRVQQVAQPTPPNIECNRSDLLPPQLNAQIAERIFDMLHAFPRDGKDQVGMHPRFIEDVMANTHITYNGLSGPWSIQKVIPSVLAEGDIEKGLRLGGLKDRMLEFRKAHLDDDIALTEAFSSAANRGAFEPFLEEASRAVGGPDNIRAAIANNLKRQLQTEHMDLATRFELKGCDIKPDQAKLTVVAKIKTRLVGAFNESGVSVPYIVDPVKSSIEFGYTTEITVNRKAVREARKERLGDRLANPFRKLGKSVGLSGISAPVRPVAFPPGSVSLNVTGGYYNYQVEATPRQA